MSSKKLESLKREVSVSGMSFLRGSANYVWCTTSVLGKGATGAVFQGVNRHSGEPVAVKTFNQLSHMRPQEVQMREFEVLQKVNHENIVKLLAIEEEQEGRGKVIVMELCTGGSLFNILDDPENSHGLEEPEFLLVLKHLAAGMNHLRDNNLVHRDLKPGNIMKFIDVDGATVYKLTDFGAARELQDDQQFMSLYGTEEYLHPDMYERAVLRKPVGKSFGARVDLWSIGVTLYHVATGHLPFRPFGGRRNKETMHVITTEKSPGVISGVQTSENGPIEWSTKLPGTCQLSMGLCKLVTPLLGGLLEVDPQKMWNFDKFFSEVIKLLDMVVVHVFFVNRVQPLVVYLDKKRKLEELRTLLCEQTEVLPNNQLLLVDGKMLCDVIDEDTPSHHFPATSPSSPAILISKQEDDVILTLPEVPSLKFPSFPNLISVDHDASIGKSICSVGFAIRRRIEYFCRCVKLTELSVMMTIEVIVNQLKTLKGELDHLEKLTSTLSDRFSQLVANHRRFLMVIQMLDTGSEGGGGNGELSHVSMEKLEDLVNNKVDEEQNIRESLSQLSPVVMQLYNRVVMGGLLKKQWWSSSSTGSSYCSSSSPFSCGGGSGVERCPNKATTYVNKLRESWQHLLRDRAARTLTFNDEQFHLLEKMKMKETSKCLENLLGSVTNSLHQTTDHLADWCKIAKVQRVQAEIEETDVEKHKKSLHNFQKRLKGTEQEYQCTLSDLLGLVKNHRIQHHNNHKYSKQNDFETLSEMSNLTTTDNLLVSSCRDENYKTWVKQFIRQLHESQIEVFKLLNENGEMINEFKQSITNNQSTFESITQ